MSPAEKYTNIIQTLMSKKGHTLSDIKLKLEELKTKTCEEEVLKFIRKLKG